MKAMPKEVRVSIHLPFLKIEGAWRPDKSEREAAWEMYVELVTRISVVELKPDEGLVREALSSLYPLFGTTREILRKHGPSVAQPKGNGRISFGYLAVAIVNGALRPFLAKWHPLLLDHESTKDSTRSPLEHEQQWERHDELRQALSEVRAALAEYANSLAEVAGVPLLITCPRERGNSTSAVS